MIHSSRRILPSGARFPYGNVSWHHAELRSKAVPVVAPAKTQTAATRVRNSQRVRHASLASCPTKSLQRSTRRDKGLIKRGGPMHRNQTLTGWYRQVWRRTPGWAFTLAFVVLFCGCPTSSTPPSPTTAGTSSASVAASSPSGIASAPPGSAVPAHVVAKKRLGDRKEDVTIESPAVGARVKVRLLLPLHYETDKERRWPVLYLLHGCCDS